MNLEKYLELFKENNVSIQITLDLNRKPTVHALCEKEFGERKHLEVAEGDTLLLTLKAMKTKLINLKLLVDLELDDDVVIIDKDGNSLAQGRIVSINDYREPSSKYAVEVYGYNEDVLFFGENELIKI